MKTYGLLLFLTLLLCSCDDIIILETEEIILEQEVLFSDIVTSENGVVIPNAVVSIYANNQRFSDKTGADGNYQIKVSSELLPKDGFISMNILHKDYQPISIVYEAPLINEGAYSSNGKSRTANECPNCLEFEDENAQELFHLGDDEYGGPENSQFQKSTDGLEISFGFNNSEEYSRLRISFEAKGLQSDLFDVPSLISFGDEDSEIFLSESSQDGSYDTYSFEIVNDPDYDSILLKTTNSGRLDENYDDWEFNALSIEGLAN